MLTGLRNATKGAHAQLDAAFSALDLHDAQDSLTFLRAHALALAGLHPHFARFIKTELDAPCPDFPGMLAADIAEREVNMPQPETAAFPLLPLDPALTDPAGAPGLSYVIAGSRLGNAVIRQGGYLGRNSGMPSRYMEDDSGHAVWKALGSWARARDFTPEDQAAIEAAALAAFAHFKSAFALANSAHPSRAATKEAQPPHGR